MPERRRVQPEHANKQCSEAGIEFGDADQRGEVR